MMEDFDDQQPAGAFGEFSNAAAPHVTPQGAEAARTMAIHRRKVRMISLSALAAVVIAVPVAAYATTTHGRHAPPAMAVNSPSPGPSSTDGGTPVASAPPSATVTPSPLPSAPDGRLTIAQLTSGKVTLPRWERPVGGCVAGKQLLQRPAGGSVNRTSNQSVNGRPPMVVWSVVYANLDRDSSRETAALVSCQFGEAAHDQVVVFDRDAAGQIVTLGKIYEGTVWSVKAHGGGVALNVSDMQACCSTPRIWEEHQNRTYAWHGTGYRQTGGPTTFISHAKPNTFAATATKVTWGAVDTMGNRRVTIVVKVTNLGPYRSNRVAACPNANLSCRLLPGLAVGAARSVTLTTSMPANRSAAEAKANGDSRITIYELGSMSLYSSGHSVTTHIDISWYN